MRSREHGQLADMNLHDFDIMTEAKEEGILEKAVENAVMLVKKYKATPETAAQDAGAPLDKVLEALELQKSPLESSSERP